MRYSLFTLLFLIISFLTKSQNNNSVTIPLGGNTFFSPVDAKDIQLTNTGIKNWTNKNVTATVYVRFIRTGSLNIQLTTKANVPTIINILTAKKAFIISVRNNKWQLLNVGTVTVNDTGYLPIQIIPQQFNTSIDIESISISGSAVDSNISFVKNNDGNMFYWGRRGPSVHLNYTLPANKNIEWFYNELTVPIGSDPVGSYFMSNGFGEGYFGIQVNSTNERRILFSVWSPYKTDNPNEIPESHQIKLIKKGNDVHAGSFGNEGSGGQSYMKYNWHAGTTYKFLTHIVPVNDSLTQYTSYFFATEENKWLLIASFIRPHTHTYYKHAHSFLENFDDAMGAYNRKVYFNNEWACDTTGEWFEINSARFTTDATGRIGARKDYKGSIEKDNFMLSNGGFFSDYTTPNTIFEKKKNDKKPAIDFNSLP